MNGSQSSRSDTLAQVQTFLDRHADIVGAVNRTAARRRLDAAIVRFSAAAPEQERCDRLARDETDRQRAIERELKQGHMTPIAKLARASLENEPTLAALTPATGNKEGRRLVEMARAMKTAAESFTYIFLEAQFPPDFLTQLASLADALDASMAARAEILAQRVEATRQLALSARDGRAAVALLDAVISRLIAGDLALLREWRDAKRVQSFTPPRGGAPVSTERAREFAGPSAVQ
jgi:hypothetical protein